MTLFDITLFWIRIAPSWYGFMYALAFMIGYYLLLKRKIIPEKVLESLVFYVFIGVLLWGRLGYVLFYNPEYYIANPVEIFYTWHGGMSFHGGVIGVIISMIIFAHIHKMSFLLIADQVTSILPIWLWLGRIGNYINKELLGFSPYTGPWAVIKNGISHFPSPLLEAFFEGGILFVILVFLSKKNTFPGKIWASFLIWYGIFRFTIEYVRIPDAHIGYLFFDLTLWQILSIPMVVIGAVLYVYLKNRSYNTTTS